MTKTEYNQFIIELEFIGKDKNYVGIFNKVGKALSFKESDKILKDKRNAYNFQISKLFDQYGIENEELFDSFNKIWKELYPKDDKKKFKLSNMIVGGPMLFPAGIVGGVGVLYAQKLNELNSLMKSYINEVYQYCEDYAKGELDGK